MEQTSHLILSSFTLALGGGNRAGYPQVSTHDSTNPTQDCLGGGGAVLGSICNYSGSLAHSYRSEAGNAQQAQQPWLHFPDTSHPRFPFPPPPLPKQSCSLPLAFWAPDDDDPVTTTHTAASASTGLAHGGGSSFTGHEWRSCHQQHKTHTFFISPGMQETSLPTDRSKKPLTHTFP